MRRAFMASGWLMGLMVAAQSRVGVAQAQEVAFPASGLVAFLPPGEVIADGMSYATVHVVALAPDGKPMLGLRPRVTASEGTVQGWAEVGGGVYSLNYIPPRLDAPREAVLRLRGKTLEKEEVSAEISVPLRVPGPQRIEVRAQTNRAVLGIDSEIALDISALGLSDPADLILGVTAGEVANVIRVSPGRFTAKYVLPKVNYPQIAVITVADRRAPTKAFAEVAIALHGRTDYPVKTSPGASVVLRVGGRDFGPAVAGPDGRAAVPIIVPPGVQQGMIRTTLTSQVTESPLDLRIPETRRLRMFPVPVALPSEAGLTVPVRVVVLRPSGEPDTAAKTLFSASSGTFSEPKHEGGGVYVASYSPPSTGNGGTASLQVSLPGSTIQVDSQSVVLLPEAPATLALTTDPEKLVPGIISFRATARLASRDQLAIPGRRVRMDAVGARLKDTVQDARNGNYRAEFSVSGIGSVDVVAVAALAAGQNPLDRVVLISKQSGIANDGAAGALLIVLTLDAYGVPVPKVQVALRTDGDGSIPPEVTTDENGVGIVAYIAGRAASLVRIEAVAADHRDGVGLIQGIPSFGSIPESGDATAIARAARWGPLVEMAAPSASSGVGGSATAPAGAKVDRFDVRAEPSNAAPGGSVVLKIRAVDVQSRGVAGKTIDLLASNCRVGSVRDLGGGAYEASLTVAEDASGDVKVALSATEGGAGYTIKIPISAGTAPSAGWGALSEAGAPGMPVPPVVAKPPRVKPAATGLGRTRLAVGYSGSSYVYAQNPTDVEGPLLPRPLLIGQEYGTSNALSTGVVGDVEHWLHPSFGLRGQGRYELYQVTASFFGGNTVKDGLVDVSATAVGRFGLGLAGGQASLGPRLGFRYSDAIFYEGCLEDGCVVQYDTVTLPGAEAGVETSFELPQGFARLGWSAASHGTDVYRTAFDARLGVAVGNGVFVTGGVDRIQRSIGLVGEESGAEYGRIDDARWVWTLGVGYAL